MNLWAAALPDFSAEVCRALNCAPYSASGQGWILCCSSARRTPLASSRWNTPWFILDRSQEFSAGRGDRPAPFARYHRRSP